MLLSRSGHMKVAFLYRRRFTLPLFTCLLCFVHVATAQVASAQDRAISNEIVANLAGGRVIVHVARDDIIFAAIDQPIEKNSVPPRVLSVNATHIDSTIGSLRVATHR